MTDLEMTRLCAEAMRLNFRVSYDRFTDGDFVELISELDPGNGGDYDPLHDDAQVMALVKKFPQDTLTAFIQHQQERWMGRQFDLNRAIVECVAKMQTAKAPLP